MSGSGICWAICKFAAHPRQITMSTSHHSVFYRPDAYLAAQPTVSKHWDILLSQEILDAIKHVVDGNFIFQQGGALMLIAFNTVLLLQCKTPIFLFSWLQPQKSSLNSNDDEIEGAIQQYQHEL